MNLADNLKKIRKENNLSQEALADKLNVSRQSVSKWESGVAYPEMDKVIQLSKMFNVSVDELLNQDIKKVNEEKNSKIDINKYIDSFLNFLTKSYDMMNGIHGKQMFKFLFEQIFFGFVLFILVRFSSDLIQTFFNKISFVFGFNTIITHLSSFIMCFVDAALVILGIVIFIIIYKKRYLDYYVEYDNDERSIKDDNDERSIKDDNEQKEDILEKKENKKVKERIIIRDPKHSEYRFISGILKIFALLFKCFICLIIVFASIILVALLVSLVLSLLFIKTGLAFLGGIIILLSLIAFQLVVISSFYYFVIDRKLKSKLFERVLIISVITFGLGMGILLIGLKDFKIGSDYSNKTEKIIEMNDNLYFDGYYEIDFVEEDRNDLRVVIEHCKHSVAGVSYYDEDTNKVAQIYISFNETINDLIKDINDKMILTIYDNARVTVYTSKENIEKIKENYDKLDELTRPKEEIE